jgi:Rrf2 family protein
MLRIPMRADYGARAMIDLAQRHGKGLNQSGAIANRQQIPESYLERLLTSLRRAGLIRSVRGPSGGHELARVPSSITLGEVWEALEGNEGMGTCLDEAGSCTVSTACALQDVWQELDAATHRILNGVTLEQLAERQSQREGRSVYHI